MEPIGYFRVPIASNCQQKVTFGRLQKAGRHTPGLVTLFPASRTLCLRNFLSHSWYTSTAQSDGFLFHELQISSIFVLLELLMSITIWIWTPAACHFLCDVYLPKTVYVTFMGKTHFWPHQASIPRVNYLNTWK